MAGRPRHSAARGSRAARLVAAWPFDEFVDAVSKLREDYLKSPIAPSAETRKLLDDVLAMTNALWHRLQTAPTEVTLAQWAKAKGVPYKTANRWFHRRMIPGAFEECGRLLVRNELFSARQLVAGPPRAHEEGRG